MGKSRLEFPLADAKLVNRLRWSNWRNSALLRYHPKLGFIRLTVIGHRYYDRGAGGFMAGGGGWTHEGRVTCSTYPELLDNAPRLPEIRSIAGWGFTGTVPVSGAPGQIVHFADKRASRPKAKQYEVAFWTIGEAINFANGEDGGAIARETLPVRVRRLRGAYKLAVVAGDHASTREEQRSSSD